MNLALEKVPFVLVWGIVIYAGVLAVLVVGAGTIVLAAKILFWLMPA